ncbi:class I SAM-dependent methyltransferase [Pseudoalteromonas piscicida]|uniref:class I SAM-dependent methyltransferase n=1 Tax=Pseudoalteromonas piscicida TaxID=43662 RepID=UPI001C95430C|nr:class I SAM-dependent methyltransferase [Pseudoalteromonas piscicida]QZO14328.1 class I SAM-dependent methyltransferase [Pseudoalteromonas piscicida]
MTAINPVSTLLNHLQTQAVPNELRRLFHGRGRCYEGLEQITVDWLQGQLLVSLFKEHDVDLVASLKQALLSLVETEAFNGKLSAILLQHRYLPDSDLEVLYGELTAMPIVEENGLKYGLKLGVKQNMGLFLDMRLGREFVKAQSAGARVLNLFSYTCGFSVAAIAGGAAHVVNLDMAKAALKQGRVNHQLNEHDLSKVSFLGHDLFKSWGKVRKYGPYDLIVIDPPSFQKGSFALTKDYQRILRKLPELLTPNAQVLACVNSPDVSSQFLIDEMTREAPTLTFVERLQNPPEFQDIDEQSSLKCLRFKAS